MGVILKIDEVVDVEVIVDNTLKLLFDGYLIETSTDSFEILIANGQCCCEKFGYFSTEDDLQKFIGADLLGVTFTDKHLSTKQIDQIRDLDAGGIQFVTLQTSKGSFQIAVYNAHNGHYGHQIRVLRNGICLLRGMI